MVSLQGDYQIKCWYSYFHNIRNYFEKSKEFPKTGDQNFGESRNIFVLNKCLLSVVYKLSEY
jgi:hypothetical protein